ncbi:GNAT family N-acetyltransferase [Massilia sp. PWRC2]|uniref:GNAT family N-acetyltransferase n=1 Tax=Massilia sp. PWRC2 TaxID=2804626 RepID=UPI003CF0E48F
MTASTSHPALDAIFWNTLTGPHAIHASGAGGARRYARGFSPIIAFADTTRPDFAALAPFCAAGEVFYCEGWDGACPDGWRIDAQTSMLRMVWEGGPGRAGCAPDAIALGASEGDAAVALAELCRPGPFGPRTLELGDYYGYLDNGRLIAMAGQRMRVPGYTEISGVCSHPEARGRGLARQLMGRLIDQQMARDERPFLHVMRTNAAAHALYQRMGFSDDIESTVRVLTRLA